MKSVIKDATEKKKQKLGKSSGRFKSGAIRSRSIPAAVVAHFVAKIQSLEPHFREVLQAEAVAKQDRLAEMEAIRAQNLIEHSDEIMSRPKREWFASTKQKERTKEALAEKQAMIREKAGTGTHRMTRKKRRAREALQSLNATDEDNDGDDGGNNKKPDQAVAMKSAARAAKRKQQEKEREFVEESISQKSTSKKAKKKKSENAVGDSSLFKEDKVAHSKKPQIEERAKSRYVISGLNTVYHVHAVCGEPISPLYFHVMCVCRALAIISTETILLTLDRRKAKRRLQKRSSQRANISAENRILVDGL
jgi:ATP-dependent RNA helicase DDX27